MITIIKKFRLLTYYILYIEVWCLQCPPIYIFEQLWFYELCEKDKQTSFISIIIKGKILLYLACVSKFVIKIYLNTS